VPRLLGQQHGALCQTFQLHGILHRPAFKSSSATFQRQRLPNLDAAFALAELLGAAKNPYSIAERTLANVLPMAARRCVRGCFEQNALELSPLVPVGTTSVPVANSGDGGSPRNGQHFAAIDSAAMHQWVHGSSVPPGILILAARGKSRRFMV
jgi:hypothetical protein